MYFTAPEIARLLPTVHSKGRIRVVDNRGSEPRIETIHVVQLNSDSWMLHPSSQSGTYMHVSSTTSHADFYRGKGIEKGHAGAYIRSNFRFSGTISPFFIPCNPETPFGFGGSIVGCSGAGDMTIGLTNSGLTISATDKVYGRLYLGSIDSTVKNVFFASGAYSP